jgi:putative ABC transport system permease protein
MSARPIYERVYRLLLRLLPEDFRTEFEQDMTADFRDQHEAAVATKTRLPVARLWNRTALDLVRLAPREHFEILKRDVGYALRTLRRRPAFAAGVLLTLAVGIGLTTAIFTVVHGVLIRGIPIQGSDRLVRLYDVSPAPERTLGSVSSANFLDWRAQATTIHGMALLGWDAGILAGDGYPEQLQALTVTEDFFSILGATPLHGRLFVEDDYRPLRTFFAQTGRRTLPRPDPAVIVITHGLWQRRFGGRAGVVGERMRLDGKPVEIVGVLGPDFWLTRRPDEAEESLDYFVPAAADPGQRRARYLKAIGRLAPGVSLSQAQAELDVIGAALAVAYPDANKDRGVLATPLREATGETVRTELWFLFGAAICVLLVACANVTNLILTHATGRRHEVATRLVLGATRHHLIRQALTEGFVLAGIGGAAGVALAYATVPLLISLAPATIPRLDEVVIDWRILVFALTASTMVGLSCGMAANAAVDHRNPGATIGRAGVARSARGRRVRAALTAGQLALALMLVVASALMVRTMRSLGALELGFDPASAISVGITPDSQKHGGTAGVHAFEATLMTRMTAHPGVSAVGIGTRPLGGGMGTRIRIQDGPEAGLGVDVDAVSPDFFKALGLALREGRRFTTADGPTAPRVAILNEAAAQALWPDGRPLGRTFLNNDAPFEVVGIVANVRRRSLEAEPPPVMYLPHMQASQFLVNNMIVRTKGDPRELLDDVRRIVAELDPDQALVRVATLEDVLSDALAPRRFILRLIGLFSVLALGLALLGVYGVVAESVAQRVPEIGIRMALGARPADVVRMVVSQGAWMVLAGLTIGLLGAIAAREVMASFVFGVPTSDPAAYVAAGLSLAATALASCLIPARTAAAIDPVVALRQP